ncbi:MAG: hypothetical protein HHJ13_06030, partial [Phycicoccus sp.]|nr:hypothetical protein [Phycicoccus sp.]
MGRRRHLTTGTRPVTNTTSASDDWDKACHEYDVDNLHLSLTQASAACGTSLDTTGATAFITEATNSSSIFWSGGSKDPQDLSSWRWKDGGGLPDKDNLVHGFAARYSGTDEILFFGSDRYDNSGDAQQGFWFFQNKVAKAGDGTFDGTSGDPALHKDGDLLILSDFSNGGQVSTINVYRWDSSCAKAGAKSTDGTTCGDANLATLSTSTASKCSDETTATQKACGIVNPAVDPLVKAPWTFVDKSATPDNGYLNGEFFEGGINLSEYNLEGECFASFASETRSSTSTTATLKDFVLGDFGDCTANLTTQVSASSVNPGVQVQDTATVVGNRPTVTPTGDVEFFLCSFAAGTTEVCDDLVTTTPAHNGTGTSIGSAALQQKGAGGTAAADSAFVNTGASPLSHGRYCIRAEWPGDSNYVGALTEFAGATECFTVVQHSTTTETHPRLVGGTSNLAAPVAVNTNVVDHALITGADGFGEPTGTVEFFICNPSQVTGLSGAEVCATGGTALDGNGAGTAGNGVPTALVSGETFKSEATSSPAVTANVVGTWCFRANYISSTGNYTGSGDAHHNECFTVEDSSSVTTSQNWLPNDTATVTATGGTALNGTLTFTLYTGATCGVGGGAVANYADATTPVTFSRTLTNATSLADRTKVTGNTDYYVKADASVSWKVTFTSSDSSVTNPSSSSCEKTS